MLNLLPAHSAPTVEAYNGLRVAVGWAAFPVSALEAAYKQTLFFSCIYEGSELTACGRAVGDGYCYVYLQDIMVLPRVQRKGLGTIVVKDLLAQAMDLLGTAGYCGLLAVNGTENFYQKFGFESQAHTNTAMGFYVKAVENEGD